MSILGGECPQEEAHSALEVELGLFSHGVVEFREPKPGPEGVDHQRARVGSPRQGSLLPESKVTIQWGPLEIRNHEIIFNYQTHHQVLLGKD